jgi:hypothetical protein
MVATHFGRFELEHPCIL